jgi:hypothetical protein
MRDERRIDGMLEIIRELWKRNPDLRLGQLLLNAASVHCPALFYLEDEELSSRIVAFRDASVSSSGADRARS